MIIVATHPFIAQYKKTDSKFYMVGQFNSFKLGTFSFCSKLTAVFKCNAK